MVDIDSSKDSISIRPDATPSTDDCSSSCAADATPRAVSDVGSMPSSPATVFMSATAPTTADTKSSEISASGRTACTVSVITALITPLSARSIGSSDDEAISAIRLAASVTTITTSDEPIALATDCVVDNKTLSCAFLRCADCANTSPA